MAVSAGGGGRLTETGLSLGTPFYMSPEQATGDQAVGPASDTFALACVLYEMLVGEPPYPGSTAQAVLGKIIQGLPVSATAIRPSVPANVDAAIRKALEKLPADRFTSAQEFARALADPAFRHGELDGAVVGADPGPWNRLTLTFAALFVLATGVAGVFGWSLLRPEPVVSVERFPLSIETGGTPGISPDGSAVVFDATNEDGQDQVWLRRWENLTPTPIPGTEGAGVGQPVISPSGDEVAFIADGQLKVAPLSGGVVRTLTDSAVCCSRWGPDGFIYYSPIGRAINRVPATGGAVEVVTGRDQEGDGNQGDFQVLPGGEVAVFTNWGTPDRIEAMRLSTGERKVLTPGVKPYVTPLGHLVFASLDGEILAAPFDADNMELTGAAVPLVEGVFVAPGSYPIYSLSQTGTLVYLAGPVLSSQWEFVWVTRSGQATPVDPGYTVSLPVNTGWSLSPDETRVAFNSRVDGNIDVRIKHLPNGPEERITFSEDPDERPFWTPDGQSVTYFSGPLVADLNVWSKRADGTGEPVLVLDDVRSFAQGSWSPDGESLVLRAAADASMGIGQRDIMSFRPGVDSAAVPLVASDEFAEGGPALSPDGRWLAYSSAETGRDEGEERA